MPKLREVFAPVLEGPGGIGKQDRTGPSRGDWDEHPDDREMDDERGLSSAENMGSADALNFIHGLVGQGKADQVLRGAPPVVQKVARGEPPAGERENRELARWWGSRPESRTFDSLRDVFGSKKESGNAPRHPLDPGSDAPDDEDEEHEREFQKNRRDDWREMERDD
jgi:hypothetical protein